MTEPEASAGTGAMATPSPGALLRRARQGQGLHIAALAAALKVNPRKLEALESDQFDELPDVAFVRALAKAVCRHLKIDPQEVLALLPAAVTTQPKLERVTTGLNTPFRDHVDRHDPGEWPAWLQLRFVAPAMLVLAALAFWFMPAGWAPWTALRSGSIRERPASPPPAASQPGDAAPATRGTVVEPVVIPPPAAGSEPASFAPVPQAGRSELVAAPAAALAPTSATDIAATVATTAAATAPASMPPVPLPAGMLALRAGGESWVEVTDGAGDVLISRLLAPGQAVGLNGVPPLRVRIGNAEGMQLRFKGRPVELRAARDNTARLELR